MDNGREDEELVCVRIAAAQMQPCWEDPKAGLEKAEECIRIAAREGASFIIFPEQFATGWDPESHRHIQALDGEIITALQGFARKYAIAILGSVREIHDPLPRNTAVAIDNTGAILASYAKIHLFSPAGEDKWYNPGDALGIFSLNDFRIGIAVCYDLRFADLFSLYRDAGVTLLVVPSSWPAERQDHFLLLSKTRAVEFQMYIAAVNITGTTPQDRYCGGSQVINPLGECIASADDREMILLADLFPEPVADLRKKFPIAADRRTDLYGCLGMAERNDTV
ncbi:MAG: carbon-nitrogen hydrolase family protein [Methanospirillaceae archaeon]|nr:carbon-nitrogen hydrolase family protein [Methanospirillaceae archaeon]